jgi:hypothetical protein
MALIFIHGVNTRKGVDYDTDVAARNELLRRLILSSLKKGKYAAMAIVNPYWGDQGVSFRWDQATVPKVGVLAMGGGGERTPRSDGEMAALLGDMVAGRVEGVRALGGAAASLKEAAAKDLPRFMETVLSPIILSEMNLEPQGADTPAARGEREALLLLAADAAARDPNTQAAAAAARSDDELLEVLKTAVRGRFESLVKAAQPGGAPEAKLKRMGPGWLNELRDRIEEIFNRVKGAPARAASVAGLSFYRDDLHANISRFFGDVFVYLDERGTAAKPGPIIRKVLDDIRAAPAQKGEPTIVLTHSMGGNILYDLVTYYAPDLVVDAWISVAGQVGQFEEMKIFKASDKSVRAPHKVHGLAGRVKYWLNIYDPVDIFSFLTAPVFEEVKEDLAFKTGDMVVKAHGAYFKRPSFYRALLDRLEGALP